MHTPVRFGLPRSQTREALVIREDSNVHLYIYIYRYIYIYIYRQCTHHTHKHPKPHPHALQHACHAHAEHTLTPRCEKAAHKQNTCTRILLNATYIHIYIYIYMHAYIFIYIYIQGFNRDIRIKQRSFFFRFMGNALFGKPRNGQCA